MTADPRAVEIIAREIGENRAAWDTLTPEEQALFRQDATDALAALAAAGWSLLPPGGHSYVERDPARTTETERGRDDVNRAAPASPDTRGEDMITEQDPDSAAGPSVSGQPTPEPGFEILEDRTAIGNEAWVFKCTACGQISSRYLDPIKAGGGAWEHLRRMHGLEDRTQPEPLPDSATVRARLASLTAENARLRSQLAEAREEVGRLSGALTNARAVSAARLADRDKIAHDLIRERDSLREERDRLGAALSWLVSLHDGPRNEQYQTEKPSAWRAARRALAAVPVEAPASLPESKFQPRNLDSAGDDSSQLAFPAGVPAEPDVDEFVSTPAGRAWLAGVSEREASRPDPVPDSREEIEARLKAAAAPVQPEERHDGMDDADFDYAMTPERHAERIGGMSDTYRASSWWSFAEATHAQLMRVLAERDEARAALATAEREREEVRWSHEQLRTLIERHERKLAEQLGYPERHPGIAAMVDTAHRLVAALGSTPDTGSTA